VGIVSFGGKEAVSISREGNPAECRDFLKKHGSNFP
jgi:hypothetical protein